MIGQVKWYDPNYEQALIEFHNPDGSYLGARWVLRLHDTLDTREEFARKYREGDQVNGWKPAPVFLIGANVSYGWDDPRFERYDKEQL
jgi:hypothetical protein